MNLAGDDFYDIILHVDHKRPAPGKDLVLLGFIQFRFKDNRPTCFSMGDRVRYANVCLYKGTSILGAILVLIDKRVGCFRISIVVAF